MVSAWSYGLPPGWGRVKALMHEFGEQGVSNQNWAMGLKENVSHLTFRFFFWVGLLDLLV